MSDLLMFLLGQSESCYQTIEQILDLMDDSSISFETKNSMIKELFRKAGLCEVGFCEEMAPPAIQKQLLGEGLEYLTGIRIPVVEYLMRWENTLQLIHLFLN